MYVIDAEDCELMDCEKSCSQSPTGPVCTCPPGQTLLEDGRGCSSVHPCQHWGTCSQNCVSTLHSYKCTCIQDYSLEPDGFTCKSDGQLFINLFRCIVFTNVDLV